jgi:flagellar biosynthesis protein FliR
VDEVLRQINEKLQQSRDLLIMALILGRTMPMVFLTPFLGGKLVPGEVKMGVGMLLTVLLWLPVKQSLSGPLSTDPLGFLMLMLKEVFIGFTMGFVNSHIYHALEMGGRMIDTVRGTSMSEVQDPHSKQRVTPIGDMYMQLFMIIFIVAGGLHIFMRAFFDSFISFPIDRMLHLTQAAAGGFFDYQIKLTAELLLIATLLAAPVIGATFITDVVFGILNRVAPQLNAYFMSMPVKALGGLVMIFISLDALMTRFEGFVVLALETIEKSLAILFV